jgi:hypothetical protein
MEVVAHPSLAATASGSRGKNGGAAANRVTESAHCPFCVAALNMEIPLFMETPHRAVKKHLSEVRKFHAKQSFHAIPGWAPRSGRVVVNHRAGTLWIPGSEGFCAIETRIRSG